MPSRLTHVPRPVGRGGDRSAVPPMGAAAPLLSCLLVAVAGCAHLAQPQTYVLATARVDQQRREYLAKELVAGLPEAAFRRWYTRRPDWADGLRPYILDEESRDGRTVYRVGSDGRTIAEISFRDGTLEEVGEWILSQESIVSSWRHVTLKPRAVPRADLDRIARLDPVSEPFRPEDRPQRGEVCRFEAGSVVETIAPLAILAGRGSEERRLSGRPAAGGSGTLGTLPAGTRLVVRHWGPLSGRLAKEGGGADVTRAGRDEYVVDTNRTDLHLCPEGRCVPVGSLAGLARDLLVIEEDTEEAASALAVAPEQSRVPVWARRAGTIEAGEAVRILAWDPCPLMTAEIEVAGAAGRGLPARPLKVPLAPPGLFVPLSGSGDPGAIEAEAAGQTVQ